jgi:hypothetical protein
LTLINSTLGEFIIHDVGGVFGQPLDTLFLVSHDFMVMALGSCVKWPLYDHLTSMRIFTLIMSKIDIDDMARQGQLNLGHLFGILRFVFVFCPGSARSASA